MLPEIITSETKITIKDVEESWAAIRSKAGFDKYGNSKYAKVTLIMEIQYDEDDSDNNWYFTAKVECGIRSMGDLSVEDMEEAANQIKMAAKITKKFNDRLNNIKIVRNKEDK